VKLCVSLNQNKCKIKAKKILLEDLAAQIHLGGNYTWPERGLEIKSLFGCCHSTAYIDTRGWQERMLCKRKHTRAYSRWRLACKCAASLLTSKEQNGRPSYSWNQYFDFHEAHLAFTFHDSIFTRHSSWQRFTFHETLYDNI